MSGKQARKASYINMTTTLLGTASSIALMGAAGMGSATKGGTIVGGKGGTTTQTQQFGEVWSPYKLR
jgi:hypothetical protein